MTDLSFDGAVEVAAPRRWWPPRRSFIRRLLRIKLAAFGVSVISTVVFVSLMADLIAQYDPNAIITFRTESPSGNHWLGTDQLGRDQFSRLVFGARASLMVSALAASFAVTVGSFAGLVAAYARGSIVDALLMRTVDAMLAVPGIVLPLLLIGTVGGGIPVVALALGVGFTPSITRLMRGQALAQLERDYVLAARSLGATPTRVMLRHVSINSFAPIIVAASLGMSGAVIAEAGLSFLGVGVVPPTPTWGTMLSTSLQAIRVAPWQVFAPGMAIFLLVLSFNFLGDALRDLLDPRLRGAI